MLGNNSVHTQQSPLNYKICELRLSNSATREHHIYAIVANVKCSLCKGKLEHTLPLGRLPFISSHQAIPWFEVRLFANEVLFLHSSLQHNQIHEVTDDTFQGLSSLRVL